MPATSKNSARAPSTTRVDGPWTRWANFSAPRGEAPVSCKAGAADAGCHSDLRRTRIGTGPFDFPLHAGELAGEAGLLSLVALDSELSSLFFHPILTDQPQPLHAVDDGRTLVAAGRPHDAVTVEAERARRLIPVIDD